ncbi:MAG TPA: hypothetical protein VMU30_01840, partial [Bacteroidota bacterium]|nr:hypothetical protein [Bacteroidota bacterium]
MNFGIKVMPVIASGQVFCYHNAHQKSRLYKAVQNKLFIHKKKGTCDESKKIVGMVLRVGIDQRR